MGILQETLIKLLLPKGEEYVPTRWGICKEAKRNAKIQSLIEAKEPERERLITKIKKLRPQDNPELETMTCFMLKTMLDRLQKMKLGVYQVVDKDGITVTKKQIEDDSTDDLWKLKEAGRAGKVLCGDFMRVDKMGGSQIHIVSPIEGWVRTMTDDWTVRVKKISLADSRSAELLAMAKKDFPCLVELINGNLPNEIEKLECPDKPEASYALPNSLRDSTVCEYIISIACTIRNDIKKNKRITGTKTDVVNDMIKGINAHAARRRLTTDEILNLRHRRTTSAEGGFRLPVRGNRTPSVAA